MTLKELKAKRIACALVERLNNEYNDIVCVFNLIINGEIKNTARKRDGLRKQIDRSLIFEERLRRLDTKYGKAVLGKYSHNPHYYCRLLPYKYNIG